MNGLVKFCLILALFLPLVSGAKEIGPNVAVYKGQELKLEDGSYSYFVMFKSLLANLNTANDYAGGVYNPQADACLDQSTYTLDMSKVPLDANIVRAFIIWTGAQPTLKMNDFTDNQVRLSFAHDSENALNADLDVVGRQSRLNDAQDFEFGAVIEDDANGTRGFFTYRVEVTDFFKQIQETGRSVGLSDGSVDGLSLYGNYTVSGLDCTNDAAYLDLSVMVSSWSIVVLFSSEEVTPKKLYIYDGFHGYQHMNSIIQITGFEFPDKPSIRLTMIANEGDPGLAAPGTSQIPESLQIKGDYFNYEQLFNTCNHLAQVTYLGQPFYYTEIFNSISSEYSFDPSSGETCIGGTPPNIMSDVMEYAIDVDTFFIDGAEEKWANHFFKGGQQITLNLGANQDWILTNLLIMSHDTRAGLYDIPPHVGQPLNEPEKNHCGCAPEERSVCFDQEFWYAIKIQNWGDDIVTAVKVQDELPIFVDYVSGTTQFATQFEEDAQGNWLGKDWKAIADGPGGAFPLLQPTLVADQLNYCEQAPENCDGKHDRRMIRFKVKPKNGIPKNTVIENMALISDSASSTKPYRSNTGIPLKLKSGTCLPAAQCETYDMAACGGDGADVEPVDTDTTNDDDVVSACETTDVKISYAIGKNSPFGEIIVPNPSPALPMGQFSLLGETTGGKQDCAFTLTNVKVKFTKEQTVGLTNFKLIHDANNNGKFDNGETVVAESGNLASNYAEFDIKQAHRKWKENTTHYFVFVGDALNAGDTVQPNTSFQAEIEGKLAIIASDKGTPTVTDKKVPFAKFTFEPDGNSFIVTRGDKDPAVPSKMSDINTYREVLQLRTKSKGTANKVKSMTIRVPSGAVLFGEGLEKVSLWLDTDGNGTGDQMLAESGSVAAGEIETTLTLANPLSYNADEQKFLVVKADFNLSGEDKGKIQIKSKGIALDQSVQIYSLPIDSKEYQACTDPNDPLCTGPEPDPTCNCTLVTTEDTGGALPILVFFLMGIVALFVSRRVYGDR